MELKHCGHPSLGGEANHGSSARFTPGGNFFLLPPSHNIYMSRRMYMSSGLAPR
jgi:hypothetical protein